MLYLIEITSSQSKTYSCRSLSGDQRLLTALPITHLVLAIEQQVKMEWPTYVFLFTQKTNSFRPLLTSFY